MENIEKKNTQEIWNIDNVTLWKRPPAKYELEAKFLTLSVQGKELRVKGLGVKV